MGATEFSTVGHGNTAQAAFTAAVEQARHEHGNGGYTGTIAEKDSFRLITLPKTVAPTTTYTLTAKSPTGTPVVIPRLSASGAVSSAATLRANGAINWRTVRYTDSSGNKVTTPQLKKASKAVASTITISDYIDTLFNDDSHWVQNKWGAAAAIQLSATSWVFFGIASE